MNYLGPLISLAFVIHTIFAYWRVFEKAGRPGWAILIPVYNVIVLLDIAGKPWWWIFLFFVPFLNLLILITVFSDFAKAFSQGTLFAIGLIFLPPIFITILAYTDTQYVGLDNV